MSDRDHYWIDPQKVRREKIKPQGGGKGHQRNDYFSHGQKLARELNVLKEAAKGKKDSAVLDRIILEIESPEKFKVKDARLQFKEAGIDIISYVPSSDTRAIAFVEKSKLESFESKILDYGTREGNPYKSYLAALESISSVSPESKVDPSLTELKNVSQSCLIGFFNLLTKKERNRSTQLVKNQLIEFQCEHEVLELFDGAVVIEAVLTPYQVAFFSSEFMSVSSIESNSRSFITEAVKSQALPNPLNVVGPESDLVVAVIDTGIAPQNTHLSQLVVGRIDVLPGSVVSPYYDHGTLVASRIAFGDGIESSIFSTHQLEAKCKLYDIRVFGRDQIGEMVGPKESDLIRLLNKHVPLLANSVRVFNLSLGFTGAPRPGHYSILAQLMDKLSLSFGVIFVNSAGNTGPINYPSDFEANPALRITIPAEALHAISVGSHTADKALELISKRACTLRA